MSEPIPSLLRSEPGNATLIEKTWAGRRLGRLRDRPGQAIGESWEFSTVPGHVSAVHGRPLDQVLDGPLPFLAKLIDTATPLSVQVHPGDTPQRMGKEEAWVVLEAEAHARILCGVRSGVSMDELSVATKAAHADPGAGDALLDLLEQVPVATGTCIVLPAGTIHAIGGGVLLAEIQQPTDATFRIFDYGRDRPLHIDEALEVVDIDARPQVWHRSEASTALVGKHVRLDVIAAERKSHRAADGPAWIVSVEGDTVVDHASGTERLGTADTVLCTTSAQVSGTLAVIGTCRARSL